LRQSLPEHMVPGAWVELAALPLTPNGKVDRKALPAPAMEARSAVAPRTPTEEVLAGIWARVLGLESVGAEDSFFHLGGHSLLATQVVSRVREAFGVELPLRRIFETPTLASLARTIDLDAAESSERLDEPKLAGGVWSRIERGAWVEGEALPLSFAQERLWFLDQLDPGSPVYNINTSLRLGGRLDIAALGGVLTEIARRHSVLRARFGVMGQSAVQRVAPAGAVDIPVVDLSALPEAVQGEEVRLQVAAEARRPFDLVRGPMLRASLLRLAEQEHVALFAMHHIASDGWSMGVLVREVVALYPAFAEGQPSPLPELPIQYADYALWQRRWQESGALEEQLAYWRGKLAGAPPLLDLPGDRPRLAVQRFRGDSHASFLSAELFAGLRQAGQSRGATLFMTLAAAFAGFLSRVTDQEDLVLGTPTANRNRTEIEGLIGFFVNTLVLRADLSRRPTVLDLLVRMRTTILEAFAHQDAPFEKLVDELKPERSLSHSPLFQVMISLQNASVEVLELPGLELRPVERGQEISKFDLTLTMVESALGLHTQWRFNSELFDRSTMARLAQHFQTFVAAAAVRPGALVAELPLLGAQERQQILAGWSRGETTRFTPRGLHEMVAEQAATRPDAVAVVSEAGELTYAGLNRRANRLARRLRRLGVGPEVLVGLCAERSPEMIVGLIAVLKAGGAYVPLDPAYPPERLAWLLADSGVPVLLIQERLLTALPPHEAKTVLLEEALEDESGEDLPARSGPENLAYVIYTSGSTGTPKGVLVSHRGLDNLAEAQDRLFEVGPASRVLQYASLSFDASVSEVAMAFRVGAALVLAARRSLVGPELIELLREQRITTVTLPPTVLAALPQAALPALRTVVVAGEACPVELARRWAVGRRLVNAYGPTETTVCATGWVYDGGERLLIGRPLQNMGVWVLDAAGEPLPAGVPGELLVGGLGLARGYRGRPELTAERFVPHPFAATPGERLYRTGDLVRFTAGGELEFLGRLDHQVKILGVRVELGEVEAALLAQPGVREAVVVARQDGSGPARLVAYVVPAPGLDISALDGAGLRTALAASLPEALVPSAVMVLPELPLTANGKVDRKALPAPGGVSKDAVAPRAELERFLAGLWRETLGLPSVGIHDDFFALGGNSITGAMFVNRLQQELGEIVHVVVMFDAPTVAKLAAYLTEHYPETVARLFGVEALGERRAQAWLDRIDETRVEAFRALIPPLLSGGEVAAKNPPAAFILSPPRSGSTLLRVMLAGNPRLFAPPELELLSFHTLAERREAFPGRNSFWLEGVTRAVMEIRHGSAEEAEALLSELEGRGATTRELYGLMQEWIGDRILVDKTPSYALDLGVLRRAEEVFADARYIHLLRHPYGMIRSFEEAKLEQVFFRHPHSLARRELAELIWLVSQRNIREFLREVAPDRQHRVRFEDLVAQPERELRDICDFLGIDYHPAMAEPYADKSQRMTDGIHSWSRMLGDVKFHQHSGVDRSTAERWREEMQDDFLGDVTWGMAEELGYPPERQGQGSWIPIEARPVEPGRPYPLSFAQERLWFLDQLQPGTFAYNVPFAVRLTGRLDAAALAATLREIVRRHASLRTSFGVSDGEPVQRIAPAAELPFPRVDLGGLPPDRREEEVGKLALAESRRSFDLTRAPMLRALLVRLEPKDHALLLTLHHIAADGWSVGVLVREVVALYQAFAQGEPSPLSELPVQYVDFALWQRGWLQGAELAAQLAFWRDLLVDVPVLQLATDRPRTALQSYRGANLSLQLPAAVGDGVRALSQRLRATPFMILLAGFEALLQRYTGQNDLIVGSTIANRTRRELEGLIGFFVNTLALRADLGGDPSFDLLLARVRESTLGAFAHQDLPFEKLVAELQPERDLSRSPLFQVLFQFQNANAEAEPVRLPELELRPMGAGGQTAKFDLVLNTFEAGPLFGGTLKYNTDLFERATAARIIRHFATLLTAAVTAPARPLSELPLLSDEESHQLIREWNEAPVEDLGSGALHERFAAQAARSPEAVAVVCDGERLSYGELDRQANQLARHLARLGVAAGDPVGICLERSLGMLVAILGVLKAGGAYVPLDPAYPQERLAFLLADSRPPVLITEESLIAELPEPDSVTRVLVLDRDAEAIAREADTDPGVAVSAEHPAYVIYTSGSTGRPKGVVIRHGNAARLFTATDPWFGFGPDDVWTLFHSYAFDFSVWEIWGALLYGGRLVVVPYWVSRSPEAFYELLRQEQVTVLNQTPSAFRQLVWAAPAAPTGAALALRYVIFGGEALEPASLAPWFERHGDERPRLINMYGITETTVHVTWRELSSQDVERAVGTVGCPIPDLGVYLLDPALRPVPIGVAGEIHVGGAGLALGYLGRPELTAERFVPNPFGAASSRLYRSGDLARRLPDGDLEYLGRIDHQVKIRGFRVELGEIESALVRHPSVREAVVLAMEDKLVVWVVPAAGQVPSPPSLSELRGFAAQSLPDYMLPSALVLLDALPLTAHGKVDRRALPAPEAKRTDAAGGLAPRTPLEAFVAGLWQEVLKLERVGISDDFFELGGNSISGAVVINRLQQELAEIVQVVVIFDHPTVESLAAYLAAEHPAAVARRLGPDAVGRPLDPSALAERVDAMKLARFRELVTPLAPMPAPARRNRRAVFVLSPPRSGSTLLRVMLAGHPELFAPPELELLSFNTLRERSAAFGGRSGRDSFWLEGAIRAVMEIRGCGADEARAILDECEREDLTTADLYGRMQDWLGERTLVDKTPSYALDPAILRRAEETFEEPLYIHLIRHPGGMIRSFVEAKLDQIFFRREHGFSRRELAELIWLASHENVEQFLREIPATRQHWVRFEDLLREPEAVLRGICDLLGLEYDPAMAEPYQQSSARMTDGPHAESRMLGDVKFHEHSGVDASVADRWREDVPESSLGEATRAMAARLGYEVAPAEAVWQPIERGAWQEGEPLPLSFAQERLWFLDQLEPGSSAYSIPMSLHLSGALDVAALSQVLTEVVRRHAVLRTRFVQSGGSPAQVVDPAESLVLPVVDLQDLPPELGRAEAIRLTAEEKRRPFDLARGPLLRTLLMQLGAGEHAIVLNQHHIASDGWSMGVLVQEVATLYPAFVARRPSPLPDLAIQYADFALWQRGWLRGEVLEREIAYWRQRLAGVAPLELPTDRPRPAVQTSRGASRSFFVERELAEEAAVLGRGQGATLFMAGLAVFAALLQRLSGQDDVAVGTPIAGRNRAELEGLIGFFVNTLVLRVDGAGEPGFRELLARVRETSLGAFAHQELPFEKVVEELQPQRDLSRSPLFQVMFALQNAPAETTELPGLVLRPFHSEKTTSKFDLTFSLSDTGAGLAGGIEFNLDLFDPATIDRLAQRFTTLLRGIVADPGQPVSELPLLDEAEVAQLAGWSRSTEAVPEAACIHELFEAWADRDPIAAAVVTADAVLSYGELESRANRLARRLQRLGVGPEVTVGLSLPPSVEGVVALLAILKSGGVYLPLDPSYPQERRAWMLADSGARVLVTRESLKSELPVGPEVVVLAVDTEAEAIARERSMRPVSPATLESLAYVIYTSGSTGTPKGVGVEHGAAACHLGALLREYGLGAGDRFLQMAAWSFDTSIEQLLTPLAAGATLALWEGELDLTELSRRIVELEVTVADLTPALLQVWSQEEAGREAPELPVRLVISGGDTLSPKVARLWPSTPLRGARLLNVYGPTETVVTATVHDVEAGAPLSAVPIGRPLPGRSAHVLDRRGQPVPAGVPGELALGGVLARGYLGRPEATAERFLPDAFSGEPGARLYRTGDRVRWLASGELDFLGRIDQQVKVRGFRIEPGEIEAALARHPAVAQAAVVVTGDGAGRRLVAFLVGTGESPIPTAGELRAFLGRTLPDYMTPASFVEIGALPLTPAGKVDRRLLAGLAPAPEAAEGSAAPSTPIQEILAGIWAEVLHLSGVGADDDFFALGGHSLLATQVVSRVREALGVELPLRSLFEKPTVETLAAEVEALQARERGFEAPPLRPVAREGNLPLSFAQERLWFLDQLQPGSAAYNVPAAVRLTGRLDIPALTATLREIVRRHESLRTAFAVRSGQPVQVIAPGVDLSLPLVDLGGLEPGPRETEARRLTATEALRPFDLRRTPLRAMLVRLDETEHALLLTLHHITSDGWSTGVLVREVTTLYRAFSQGEPSPLPELPIQYADFAVWQRGWLQGEALEAQLGYWRRVLAGAPVLQLATDRPRMALQGYRGADEVFRLPAGVSEEVRSLSRQQGATPFMVLLSAFEALLERYTGQDDLVVGSIIANRIRRELEGLIGFFVNTLALRGDLSGGPAFSELLLRARESALGAYAHQDLPFEKLVAELQPERDLSRSSLFQVVFQLQNAPVDTQPVRLPGLELRPMGTGGQTAKFDLVLNAFEAGPVFGGVLKYNTDLFERATMARIGRHFVTLLAGAVAEPSRRLPDLPLLSLEEQHQLAREWNEAPVEDLGSGVLHERFAAQAARFPEATAVVCEGERLSYGELDRQANQLALHLVGLGVAAGDPVGICLERSTSMLVAILGVLKAGGAYVPLDPAYPQERLAFLLSDSRPPVLITQESLIAELPETGAEIRLLVLDRDAEAIAREDSSDPRVPVSAEHPAYVIYTSGSTGRPKGVVIRHGNAARLFTATDRWFGFGPGDVWTLFHSYAFDFSVWEIWGALLYGGRLVVVPYWVSRSPEAFYELLREERVTVLNQTPSAFRQLIWAEQAAPAGAALSLRYVIFGGEALEPASLAPWFERHGDEPRLINMYGITETTVHVTYRELSWNDVERAVGTVGCPIPDLGVYLLDPALRPVPVGVPGEMYVSGAGLALGYLGRPELTAERFIPNPFGEAGSRLYRSGDLARRLPDGDLEYLGRIDHQVKIRGFRIELGEIESALVRHPVVREAVVLAVDDSDRRLVAWVVPAAGAALSLSDLRSFLAQSLPDYMLPSALVLLDALPLTANGKIDRRSLPAPEA
ncbi:MAG TPA: amino acid adenylation domain-containing protein, partial [Thermoanaerobaculia bacterium]|nr:amino acid adenylation domain-containing protein [Thermoanaerobaculia bacterium]